MPLRVCVFLWAAHEIHFFFSFSCLLPVMAAAQLLAAATTLQSIETLGVELDVMPSSKPVAQEYKKLTGESPLVRVCSWHEAYKSLIIDNKPEFGTMRNPKVDAILAECCDSQFGRGDETVLDTQVRESRELLIDPSWATTSASNSALECARHLFGHNVVVQADKLVLYRPGGHFGQHRDTCRDVRHIGTVVLTLGHDFEGGALTFPTEGQSTWDSGCAAAFYTDLIHQVKPVTAGTRVVLTFRVLLRDTAVAAAAAAKPKRDDDDDDDDESTDDDDDGTVETQPPRSALMGTAEHLRMAFAGSAGHPAIATGLLSAVLPFAESNFVRLLREELAEQQDGAVVLGCIHQVPTAALGEPGVQGLRGADKVLAESLLALGFQVRLVVLNIFYQSWGSDNGYVPKSERVKREVRACSDDPDVMKSLEGGAVYVRARSTEALVLREQPYIEHTGNESAPRELRYVCVGMLVTPEK